MPTTEYARLPLVAGSHIGDPNNPASAVMKDCGDTLSTLDGMQQVHFGMEVENAAQLDLLINWDSKKNHEDFMNSREYEPFLKRIGTILDGAPSLVHVDFKPDGGLAAALSAPVTEIATFFHADAPPSDHEDNAAKFEKSYKEKGDTNILGFAYGTTHEEMEKDGVKGKAAVLAIGWPSVEAHMELRSTQFFKDNIDNLRNGAKAIEMHHINTMSIAA